MKKFLFLFLILLFFIPISSGFIGNTTCDTVIINESFNYTDSFENHGWSASADFTCGFNTTPFNRTFGTNGTVTCSAGSHFSTIQQIFTPVNSSVSDILFLTLDYTYIEDNAAVVPGLIHRMFDDDDIGGGVSGLQMFPNSISLGVGRVFSFWEGVTSYDWVQSFPSRGNLSFVIDLNTGHLDMYEDDVLTLDDVNIEADDRNIDTLSLLLQRFGTQNLRVSYDNILLCAASTITPSHEGDCPFPLIFCDDFNYDFPIIQNEWNPRNTDSSLNTTIEPIDFKLLWNSNDPRTIAHTYPQFQTSYPQVDGTTLESTRISPKFSNEFRLNISNDVDNDFRFLAYDDVNQLCYQVKFKTTRNTTLVNISVTDIDDPTFATDEIIGTMTENISHVIKLVSKFTAINKSYEFNTSITQNLLDVYVDGAVIKEDIPFLQSCFNIEAPTFLKGNNASVMIDDYLMYVGTDSSTSTLPFDFISLVPVTPNVTSTLVSSTGTRDFAQSVDGLWEQFGFLTVASKVLFGLLMIVMITVFTVIFMLKSGMFSFPALLIIVGLSLIIEVFLGLIPIWVFGLMAIIGGGIAVIAVKIVAQ